MFSKFEIAATLRNRAHPVFKNVNPSFFVIVTLSGSQPEEIPTQVNACFSDRQPLPDELRRRNVIKLIGIEPQDPVTLLELISEFLKHVPAKGIVKDIWRRFHGDNATITRRELLHNFPCPVSTAEIENVRHINPCQKMFETLLNYVVFVADEHYAAKCPTPILKLASRHWCASHAGVSASQRHRFRNRRRDVVWRYATSKFIGQSDAAEIETSLSQAGRQRLQVGIILNCGKS